MKSNILFLTCFLFMSTLSAQETELRAIVDQLFTAMHTGDSTLARACFVEAPRMYTSYSKQDGTANLVEDEFEKFIQFIGSEHDFTFHEEIWNYDIRVDGNLGTVWTDYTFYLNDAIRHCGINSFSLTQTSEGWKIFHLADTRRKENCQTREDDLTKSLHEFLDQWHEAAAKADEDVFFGSMSEKGIYLGTDATEKWLRDELKAWSEKYFARESAWAFTPIKREIYLDLDQQTAWFEESLDTWMGECRGSGVLRKYPDGWKIDHYNLSVTVPNEKIEGFIELLKD